MNRVRVLGLLATIAAGSGPLMAHHPYSATYVTDRQTTIDGPLVEVVYRHPHSSIQLTAPDDAGRPRQWIVEWGSPSDKRHPIPTNVLRIGDRLVVSGSPGRDPGAFRIRGRTIVRPADGWAWTSEGSRP
jgi:hypothetical protein